jgi:hypothetical protein
VPGGSLQDTRVSVTRKATLEAQGTAAALALQRCDAPRPPPPGAPNMSGVAWNTPCLLVLDNAV